MKQITDITCKRIISEPGDMTRYAYIVFQDYSDFSIMPYKSTLSYPQKICYYDVVDITDIDKATEYTKKYCPHVNPWTLLEVVRTITELFKQNTKRNTS